jgi:hypothetical protein
VVAQVIGSLELSAGVTIVDCTTGEPETMAAMGVKLGCSIGRIPRRHRTRVEPRGPQCDAVVMAGGRREAFDAVTPLLRTFASKSFYLGSFGAGARMKLVANLALGLHRAVLAETLAFAQASGVSPTAALEVLKAGAAYSRVMDDKGKKMLEHDFTVEAKLSQHLKTSG